MAQIQLLKYDPQIVRRHFIDSDAFLSVKVLFDGTHTCSQSSLPDRQYHNNNMHLYAVYRQRQAVGPQVPTPCIFFLPHLPDSDFRGIGLWVVVYRQQS
jgi:hypothetical protein